jgi:hypothetical protein
MRGLPAAPVPVTFISREEYLRQAATALPPEDEEAVRRWYAGLATFGLAPEGASRVEGAAVRAVEVGAFYSGDTKSITMIDWGGPYEVRQAVALMAHEYTHALQDAAFDLGRLDEQASDLDRSLAVRALMEGDATYVGDRASIGLFGDEPTVVPWDRVFQRWQAESRAELLASNWPVLLSWRYFPYPFGTELVHDVVARDGWWGVDALYAAPPSGEREVLAGFAAVEHEGGPWSEDLGSDAVPVLSAPLRFQGADRMGAWIVGLYLERAGAENAEVLASGLRGDVLSVFHDESTGGVRGFWRLRFSSTDRASEAYRTIASNLPLVAARQLDRDVILITRGLVDVADVPENVPFQSLADARSGTMTSGAPPQEFGCAHHVLVPESGE